MRTFIPQQKGHRPNLAEMMSVTLEMISETSFLPRYRSIQLFVEGLFAHFFSPYRHGYHTEDVQWFLELANKQEHWKANPVTHTHQVASTEVRHLSIMSLQV